MNKITLVLVWLVCAGYGRRVQLPDDTPAAAFNPSGAHPPLARPNVATSALRHHKPQMSKSAATSTSNIAGQAIQERNAGPRVVLRRLLSSALLKRSVAIAARATGTLAAALLCMQAGAFAMQAGSSLPMAATLSPAGIWDSYEKALGAHPVIVKALTSLVGFTAGDILAQTLVEKVDKYDAMRTVRLGSFGFLWHGPSSHYFYGFLDNLIPGTDMKTVWTKVFCDQVLWNPVFGTIFFTYLNFAEGKTFADLKLKIQQDLLTAVKGSWGFWVPAHFVNFRFIPGDQRVLYINTLQILYNIFLSFIGNKKVEPEAEPAS